MANINRWVAPLAWAWLILIGLGIIITPHGPVCAACGDTGNLWIGIIAVVLGLVALAGRYMAGAQAVTATR